MPTKFGIQMNVVSTYADEQRSKTISVSLFIFVITAFAMAQRCKQTHWVECDAAAAAIVTTAICLGVNKLVLSVAYRR